MRIESYIKESNKIEGIIDPHEIDQSMYAWAFLKALPQIDHTVICKVQKIITLNQPELYPNERGYYRDTAKVNVRVGGRIAPDYGLVKGMMDNWLLDYQSLRPLEAHVRFEKIHPFVDGNGRTGRMLMWWDQLHRGLIPTKINYKDRWGYYKNFD